MTRTSVILAIVGITHTSAFADFPVGHWSNKKDGFKIVTFGLRSNGTGYFAPSMSQLTTVVRWKKDGDAIRITIAAPPENPIITFLPTGDPKVGRLKFPDQPPQEFHLIDENEPDDLEALARARAEKEAARRQKSFIREEAKFTELAAL